MPRPIDADKLERMLQRCIDRTILGGIEQNAYIFVLQSIRAMPSMDANLIVRCKECANQQKHGDAMVCLVSGKVVLPSFYCNFGTKNTGV